MISFPKPSRTNRKKERRAVRLKLGRAEDRNKAEVRRRDRQCRFPLCGCRRMQLSLEVAHSHHKGAGGNPDGSRSQPKDMILLCEHRHRFGTVSWHKGTLRAVPLSRRDGFEGPVKWLVALGITGTWREVAREVRPGVLEPLAPEQRELLERLAGMTI